MTPAEKTTEEIIRDLKQGREPKENFRLLYDRYSIPILGFFRKRGVNDAEELKDDVFVAVYNNLEGLREETKFEYWLFAIARNKYKNWLKSEKSRGTFEGSTAGEIEDLDEWDPPAPVRMNPEYALLEREKVSRVLEVLHSLPDQKRLVAILAWVEERSPKEIAAILPITINHLGEAELIEYHSNRLPEPERRRVEAHLAVCATCLKELVEMSDFLQSAFENKNVPSDTPAHASQFEALWDQVAPLPPSSSGAPDPKPVGSWKRPRMLFALAASLFIGFAVTGIWALVLRQENRRLVQGPAGEGPQIAWEEKNRTLQAEKNSLQQREDLLKSENRRLQEQIQSMEQQQETLLAELRQPDINIPIKNIYPSGDAQRSRGSNDINRVRIPPSSTAFVLILTDYETGYPDYTLEILDQSGRAISTVGGLKPDDNGDLTVKLERALLHQPQYRLRLSGRKSGRSTRLADYFIKIE
ncbi:MAG: sigma-70 family RNA polymerase sigma factor [Acidobacteria bacterium]|nr:sigma-70 family RNA polymerase sigma factor [Acidobacteriota bacterium]